MQQVSSFRSDLPVDSVERISSLSTPTKSIVTLSSYKYDPEGRDRSGRLEMLAIEEDRITRLPHSWDGPGVLDTTWVGNIGYVALADGSVTVFSASEETGFLAKERITFIDEQSICMMCDVSRSSQQVAACFSSGNLGLSFCDSSESQVWKAHDLEAWCIHWDRFQPHMLYSGGDDSKWAGWDLRMDSQTFNAAFISKYHGAGVCSIQCHPNDEYLLLTGSYDKSAAIWDKRSLRGPLGTISVGSGVWKLRWSQDTDHHVLAACMYDGFYLFDFTTPTTPIIQNHLVTNGLSYGCTWLDASSVLTCTFYDQTVQLWKKSL